MDSRFFVVLFFCKCIMVNTSAMRQQVWYKPPTNYFLAAQQELYKKAYFLMKNVARIFWKKIWAIIRKMTKQSDQVD